jgi:prefoldin subunit 5
MVDNLKTFQTDTQSTLTSITNNINVLNSSLSNINTRISLINNSINSIQT